MEKLTTGELSFIEDNQNQFDIEVAKLRKEEGRPEVDVTGIKEEVAEETKPEQKYDDEGVTVPAADLFRDKDDKQIYAEEFPEGMTWDDYRDALREKKNEQLIDQESNYDADDSPYGEEIDRRTDANFKKGFDRDQKRKVKAQPKIKGVDVDKFNTFADKFVEDKIKGFERVRKKGGKKQKATKKMVKAWEAEAITAFQAEQKPKKSGVTTRSASTRTPKRGAFGLAVDEVKSL